MQLRWIDPRDFGFREPPRKGGGDGHGVAEYVVLDRGCPRTRENDAAAGHPGPVRFHFRERWCQAPEPSHSGGRSVTGILDTLLATPLLLVPILVIVAMAVLALLKKLLKMAAILAIAGVLYVLLMEYIGTGM